MITFQPSGVTINAEGRSLLAAAVQAGLMPDADCGGNGVCGKCRLRLINGTLPPPDESERRLISERELAMGYRLACRVTAADAEVYMPGPARLSAKKAMPQLPPWFTPDTFTGAGREPVYGLAFDIGTTTVVGILCDLAAAAPLAAAAETNPQSVFGADVISRIQYGSESPGQLRAMQGKIIGCMNGIINELTETRGITPEAVTNITVAGNTAMSHLLLGIDAASLARSPFLPVFTNAVSTEAAGLGLCAGRGASVYVLPNIAGHVGSDITALMLASGLKSLPGVSLAIDIGTNGEIALACDGRVAACSTAAGPAFEGASIRQGMRAADGAIEGVKINGDGLALSVIGGAEPVGICGSGLIDAVAELLNAGLMNRKGRLLSREQAGSTLAERLCRDDSGDGFILYESARSKVVLTQKDIREVQLAKGAIAAGANILLAHMGKTAEDIDRVLLAGAFGSYIKTESALRIGLLPPVPPERVHAIGNAAGTGACMALLSKRQREAAEREAAAVEHIELSTHAAFRDEHIMSMYFPED